MAASCCLLVFLALFFLHAIRLAETFGLEFSGEEYLRLETTTKARKTNELRISFRTIHPSGLLFYAGDYNSQHVAVLLQHGRLMVSMSLCKERKCRYSTVIGRNLCDNHVHTLHLVRKGWKVNITIGGTKQHGVIPGPGYLLFTSPKMFVAGMPLDRKKYSVVSTTIQKCSNFLGCLLDLSFDDFSLRRSWKKKSLHVSGSPSKVCTEQHGYRPIGFPNPFSIIKLVKLPHEKKLIVSLYFRSIIGHGTLIFAKTKLFKIFLRLDSGNVVITINYSKSQALTNKCTNRNLADGDWHKLAAHISNQGYSVTIDDANVVSVKFQDPPPDFGHLRAVYVGSSGHHSTGFVGCLNKVKINGLKIDQNHMGDFDTKGVKVGQCALLNHCFPNPCFNGGNCVPYPSGFTCDCTNTYYTGDHCETPLTIKATCEAYSAAGLMNDSICRVDVDSSGPLDPFDVVCAKSSSSGKFMTSVITNKNGTQRVRDADHIMSGNSVEGEEYYHHVKYMYVADLEKMKAVINQSLECQQFISFDCFDVRVINSPTSDPQPRWVSRRDGISRHFGDGAITEAGTARRCEKQRKCSQSLDLCNWDDGGGTKWYNDSGYITDKSLLPVVSLVFPFSARDSFYTIGPLECFGSSRNKSTGRQSSRIAKESLKRLCKPLHYVEIGSPTKSITEEAKSDVSNAYLFQWIVDKDGERAYMEKQTTTRAATSKAGSTTGWDDQRSQTRAIRPVPTNATVLARQGQKTSRDGFFSGSIMFPMMIASLSVITLVVLVLCVVFMVKRKGFSITSSLQSCLKLSRHKFADDIAPPSAEPDMWMTINAGGYNVKTGKITYGTAAVAPV